MDCSSRGLVVVGRVVLVVIDAEHEGQVFTLGRGADDDLLGAGMDVQFGLLARGEDACALDDDIDAQVAPRQLARIAFGQHLDAVAVDDQIAVDDLDRAGELPVVAVILEEVGVGLHVGQVVDGNHVKLTTVLFKKGLVDLATDAAKTIDCNTRCHEILLLRLSMDSFTRLPV